jgi:hypothetical protein
MWCQRGLGVCVFVNYCFCSKGRERETIPIVWPLECFVCQFVRVDSGSLEEVDGVLHLWHKLIPHLDQEVNVYCAEGTNEMILEHLDGAFSHIDAMVARLDKLETALLWGKVEFYCLCCLIVHHVDFWGVPFAHKVFKVFFCMHQECSLNPGQVLV